MNKTDLIQQFITGLSMIIIFISLNVSPIGTYLVKYWNIALIIGIVLFIFSSTIAHKISGGN